MDLRWISKFIHPRRVINNSPRVNKQKSMQYLLEAAPPQMLLRKDVLKICSKFTEEHPCRYVISIKLTWNHTSVWMFFCKFVHIFRTLFLRNTYGGLLLIWLNENEHENENEKVLVQFKCHFLYFYQCICLI